MTGFLAPSIPTVLIVTGASRGFGRAVAVAAAATAAAAQTTTSSSDSDPQSQTETRSPPTGIAASVRTLHAFLVARSKDGLAETERQMREAAKSSASTKTLCDLHVSSLSMDLADLNNLDSNIDILFDAVGSLLTDNSNDTFAGEHCIVLVNNAGTIGYIGPTADSPSLSDMQRNIDLNITSALWLSTRFARDFGPSSASVATQRRTTLIQISSLVAIADFPTLAVYSAGKAARDRFHAVLAKDYPQTSSSLSSSSSSSQQSFKVLNYAPGPLETDMVEEIRSSFDTLDESLKGAYRQQQLDPMDSADRLMRVLQKNDFESGTHLDYYDITDTAP